MDAVEDYARRWIIKREVDQDPELESLSNWVRTIRSLVQGRIHKLKNCVNGRPKSEFQDQEAVKCLSSLHDTICYRSCVQGFQQYRVCMQIILLRMPNQGIRHT